MSYTTFEYGDLKASATQLKRGDKLSVEVAVTNTGDRDGAETVYWFITDPYSTITRPVKELKYFEKQTIRAGETRTFRFEVIYYVTWALLMETVNAFWKKVLIMYK